MVNRRHLIFAVLLIGLIGLTVSIATRDVPVHECDRLAADPVDYERVAPPVSRFKFLPKQAIVACREAAAAYPNTPRFRFQLGRTLLGLGGVDEARAALQDAANSGYAAANMFLGRIYETGSFGERDVAKALEYIQLAAEQGNQDAQIRMGLAYRDGKGREADLQQALHWFKLAADQGNPRANYLLAAVYMTESQASTNPALVIENARLAAEHTSVAAEAGMTDAQFSLAFHYLGGVGVERSPAKGLELLKAAANNGHTLAAIMLGNRYMRGEDVPQDREHAIHWFCKAGISGRMAFEKTYGEAPNCDGGP